MDEWRWWASIQSTSSSRLECSSMRGWRDSSTNASHSAGRTIRREEREQDDIDLSWTAASMLHDRRALVGVCIRFCNEFATFVLACKLGSRGLDQLSRWSVHAAKHRCVAHEWTATALHLYCAQLCRPRRDRETLQLMPLQDLVLVLTRSCSQPCSYSCDRAIDQTSAHRHAIETPSHLCRPSHTSRELRLREESRWRRARVTRSLVVVCASMSAMCRIDLDRIGSTLPSVCRPFAVRCLLRGLLLVAWRSSVQRGLEAEASRRGRLCTSLCTSSRPLVR